MNRYCFLLRVKPELLDEYRARHLWGARTVPFP
jgi:L-rhamnose mutarotase